jgi:hypothetical protein
MRFCLAVVLTALPLFEACTPEPSEVFVPGPAFHQSIQLTTARGDSATVRVGEPLLLHARRSTGPWVLTPRRRLAPDACWMRSPPPEVEAEVADNVRWLVEPAGTASFNLGIRADHAREVRFSSAGVYRLTAQSAGWCAPRFGGDTLTIVVAG